MVSQYFVQPEALVLAKMFVSRNRLNINLEDSFCGNQWGWPCPMDFTKIKEKMLMLIIS